MPKTTDVKYVDLYNDIVKIATFSIVQLPIVKFIYNGTINASLLERVMLTNIIGYIVYHFIIRHYIRYIPSDGDEQYYLSLIMSENRTQKLKSPFID